MNVSREREAAGTVGPAWISIPGTIVLVGVFFVSFVLYYS